MTWNHDTPSRHKRGYGASWDKLRQAILERDTHLCQICLSGSPRSVTPANHVDHIIPKAKGGADDADNLQSLCAPCHQAKSARDRGNSKRMVRDDGWGDGRGNGKQQIGLDGWPIDTTGAGRKV